MNDTTVNKPDLAWALSLLSSYFTTNGADTILPAQYERLLAALED